MSLIDRIRAGAIGSLWTVEEVEELFQRITELQAANAALQMQADLAIADGQRNYRQLFATRDQLTAEREKIAALEARS